MEFKVRKDFLPIFLINLLLIFTFVCSVFFFASDRVHIGWLILAVAINTFFITIYNMSIICTYCRIDESTLAFRTGVFYHDIKLRHIAKVEKSTNLHSSIAPSIHRIRIVTVNDRNKLRVFYVSVMDSDKLISMLPQNPDKLKIFNKIEREQKKHNKTNNATSVNVEDKTNSNK